MLLLLYFSANHTGKLLLVQASCTYIDTGFRACMLCNNINPMPMMKMTPKALTRT